MELLSYTGQHRQRDESVLHALRSDPSLNHRQRSILGRATRHTDAEFSISYHRTNHNVAYATARADLLDLVDKGYLMQDTSQKVFVFRARPDLQSRLHLDTD